MFQTHVTKLGKLINVKVNVLHTPLLSVENDLVFRHID